MKIKVDVKKSASFSAVLWLLCAMNTVVAWYPFSSVFKMASLIGVMISSLLIPRKYTNKRYAMFLFVCLYCLYELLIRGSFGVVILLIYTFVPFMFILFWPSEQLKNTYELFRKVVLFFAVGSSVITILYYLGLLSLVPSYELFPKSFLHSNRGDIYNVYFIFPELVTPLDYIRRACGFTLEGGHFSIVLGFVYLIDRYTHRKINPIIIIGAVFAFSPAFFLILVFTEFMNIWRWKYLKKILISLSILIISGFTIYIFLPKDMKEIVYFLAYERNVERLLETYNNTGSLTETLDERTNQLGQNVYNRMNTSERLFGGKGDKDIVLSDYRGFIVSKGIIGLSLVIVISLLSLCESDNFLKISLALSLFMVLLHRAWFFYEPFPYLMSFIATTLCRFKKYN